MTLEDALQDRKNDDANAQHGAESREVIFFKEDRSDSVWASDWLDAETPQ